MTILLAIMVSVSTIGTTILFGWGKAFDINEVAYILKTLCSSSGRHGNCFSFNPYSNPSKEQRIYYRNWHSSICPLTHYVSFLYGRYTWFDKIFEATPAYNWSVVTSIKSSSSDLLKSLAISLATFLVATVLGIMTFKKQDIK